MSFFISMIRSEQKEAAHKAHFHYISALTKPQIQTLLDQKVFQLEFFEETIHEVQGPKGRRFVLRRNPTRQAEMQHSRQQKRQLLESLLHQANVYLKEHPRAQVATQHRKLAARLESLKLEGWLKLSVGHRCLRLALDEAALQKAAQLDGC